MFLLRLAQILPQHCMLTPGCRPVLSVHMVSPARLSVKTYPVAEVRASREDRGHAHVDQKGLPVSQRLVLLLLGW